MKRLAEIIKPYLRLLRIGNLAFVAILLFVMEKWLATPLLKLSQFSELMPWWILLLLILSIVFITAGGYVINDYFDVKIDRINRPDDLVVTRHITRDGAMYLFYALTIIGVLLGLVVAWWSHCWTFAMILVVVPGLLWFYSASYKRQLLVGNIVVSFLSALVPMLIAIINADYLRHLYGETLAYTPIIGQLYVWLSGFALFAFLITLARRYRGRLRDGMSHHAYRLGHSDCQDCHHLPLDLDYGAHCLFHPCRSAIPTHLEHLLHPFHYLRIDCSYCVCHHFALGGEKQNRTPSCTVDC